MILEWDDYWLSHKEQLEKDDDQKMSLRKDGYI